MKELDFDELDKAVSSLMNDAAKTNPEPDAAPQEKTLDLSPSSSTPVMSAPLTAPPSTPTPVQAPAVDTSVPSRPTPKAPASRRGGRFMDMVHPKADMKKPEAPRPASRQGIAVAPRASFTAPAPKEEKPVSEPVTPIVPDIEVEAPSVPDTASSSAPSLSSNDHTHPDALSEWPDPLEMAQFTTEDSEKTEKEQAEAPQKHEPIKPVAEVLTPEEDTPDANESSATSLDSSEKPPLTSPFLPDAKVEKRPLGGEAPTGALEEPDHAPVNVQSEVQKTSHDANDQLPALPEDVEPILPEEFHSDLVAVEADTTGTQPVSTPAPRELDENLENKKRKEEKTSSLPQATSDNVEPVVSTGPTSIPQQYREEPSSNKAESGAIYDTDTYHQPLEHPAKKKSGWLWVVWIVIILLVGAGGGAAAYFFKLI